LFRDQAFDFRDKGQHLLVVVVDWCKAEFHSVTWHLILSIGGIVRSFKNRTSLRPSPPDVVRQSASQSSSLHSPR
jgi:hypothetical protein